MSTVTSLPAIHATHPAPSATWSMSNLRCKNVDLLDLGRLGEKLRRLGHQGRGDPTGEVRATRGIVIECIEYAKRRGTEAQGKPQRRRCFLVGEREAGVEKFRNLVFFAGLRLEPNEQSDLDHTFAPS